MTDEIRFRMPFTKAISLPDLLHGKGRAGLHSPWNAESRCRRVVGLDGFADLLEIKGAVRF